MKLKNIQLININNTLSELVDLKITGRFKFKLFKLKVTLENALDPVYLAVQGTNQLETEEILNEEQEVDIEKLAVDDLAPLELSIKQLGALEIIIDMEEV